MKRLMLALLALVIGASVVWAGTDIRVLWDANTEPDLAGYYLYMRADGEQYDMSTPFEIIDDPQATTLDLLDFPDNQGTFFFVLTAFDLSGNESGPSNEVMYICKDTVPPAAPHCNGVVQIP
jgi:hypothetical protein